MADSYGYTDESSRARQHYSDTGLNSGYTQSLHPTTDGLASAYSIMGSGAGYLGANGSPYAEAMHSMQGAYGNRALQRAYGSGMSQATGMGVGPQMQATGAGAAPAQASGYFNPWTMGWKPGQPGGDSLYLEQTTWNTPIPGVNVPSWEAGLGLGDSAAGLVNLLGGGYLSNLTGIPIPCDMLSGTANLGAWDGDNGFRVGAQAGGGVIPKQQYGWGSMVSPWLGSVLGPGYAFDPTALTGEAELISGAAELSLGNEGFTGGAQFTLGGVGATMGDFGDIGVGSDQEQQVRVGASAGIGAAGRLHWADEDGDGTREIGFGLDYGFGSVDFKSEDPLRSVIGLGGYADDYLGEGNATYRAMDWAHESIMAGGEAFVDWLTPDDQGLEPRPDPIPHGGVEGLSPWW